MAESAILLDLGRCIGCQACVASCKVGNELGEDQQYIQLVEKTHGEFPNLTGGFNNHRCYHCADAACVSVCPTGALYKEDGLTRLDRDVCSGCSYCTEACPYEVPVMWEGKSSKCDGCAATTKAGGSPWCVTTCPSNALMYGTRDQIRAEAHKRAEAMRDRYPNAQVYGETQAGGLGMLVVTPDDPELLDIPIDPKKPFMADAWQKVVQPGAVVLTLGTAVLAGAAAVISRKNHEQEMVIVEAEGLIRDSEESEEG
ncbi:MAG: 4Fe-4S dicluster domain-containing protein [Acidimicrobiia bacterium]|nr:4Fe-4S dicluster domain-containing protein [Acidimicrobiia bacterium]MDX2467464.1 4Fe-4S dicluster domain-containing protein [Acidimicrobiia bacterium]